MAVFDFLPGRIPNSVKSPENPHSAKVPYLIIRGVDMDAWARVNLGPAEGMGHIAGEQIHR
jgi:hypothetical protein